MKNSFTTPSKYSLLNLAFASLIFLSAVQTKAQLATPSFVTAFGAPPTSGSFEQGTGMAIGNDGNIYIGFRYSGAPAFGVGTTVTPPNTGGNTWVGCAKLTPSFAGVWAQATSPSGFNYGGNITVDNNLNTYTLGIINSGGSWFVTKTSPTGSILYQYVCNYSINNWNNPNGVCVDNNSNAYVCGGYDPGTVIGTHTLSYLGSGADGFVFELSPSGAPRWATPLHSAGCDVIVYADALDHAGNLWVTGQYTGTPNFGTGALPTSAGPSLFVARLDTLGNVKNVYTAANAGPGKAICIDAANYIYVVGPFSGTATWGSFSATSKGSTDAYIAKLRSSDGQFQWVSTGGGTGADVATGVSIDKNWDLTITGYFSSSATFGTETVTGNSQNSFVARYASGSGAFLWALAAAGTGTNYSTSVGTDANRQSYISGTYSGVPVFGSISLPNGGGSLVNIFVAKIDSSRALSIVANPAKTYCAGQTAFIPYTAVFDSANGNFRAGNVFTAQLSDATGSFVSPVNIGDTALLTNGSIHVTIPAGTPSGTKYLLRIISSKPYYSSVIDLDTVTINGNLNFTITPAAPVVCNGSSVTLKASAGSAYSYTWTGSSTTADSLVVSPTVTGTSYTASVTGVCTGSASVTVTVNDPPTVSISGSTTVCAGASSILTGTGGTTYVWSDGSTNNTFTASPASTGVKYYVTGTSAGCSAADTVTMTVNPVPNMMVSPASPEICAGSSISLLASGAGVTGSYTWKPSTGIATPSAASTNGSPVNTTTYTVVGMNTNGCTDSTLVTLTVNSTPTVSISTMQTICSGSSATLTASGGTGYKWTPSTGLSSDTVGNPIAGPVITTLYTVTASNGSCTASDTVTVAVNPDPVNTVSGGTTITIGASTPLSTNNTNTGVTYSWLPATGLSCTSCANPTATPSVTTNYTLTITDNSGCSKEDSALIIVKQLCGPVYMPNAFSPNGDGNNDVLKVQGNCIRGIALTVYDRWGNVVYQSNNPEAEWDGTSKGKLMNTGTYVYTLVVTDEDNNTINKQGNITLLR